MIQPLTESASTCRVVVLISGNGSNLQAIMDRQAGSAYEVVAVISNRADAFGLQRASRAGITTEVLSHTEFADRESFDNALMARIDHYQADLVVLAGFMRILSSGFVKHYAGKLLNIHPSLLPAYKGTQTHQRVLDAGDSEHGTSVHFVNEELDGGPVVRQATLQVQADDTAVSLQQRVAVLEHTIYPEVVQWFASRRLQCRDNAVFLDGQRLPPGGIRD